MPWVERAHRTQMLKLLATKLHANAVVHVSENFHNA